MEIVVKYDNPQNTPETLLTQDQATTAFDHFIQGKTPVQVKHLMFLPLVKLETLYNRLVKIRQMIERIAKGEARLVREESHIDPNTGEKVIDVPEQLAPVPASLEELKATSLQLIQNDYDISEPLFQANSIEELQAGLNYVIEQIILHSNQANDATFDWWINQVSA